MYTINSLDLKQPGKNQQEQRYEDGPKYYKTTDYLRLA